MEIENFYSFTFTIPPKKKVYYSGRRRVFSSMNLQAQCNFFNNLLMRVFPSSRCIDYDWVFELHTQGIMAGNLHIHGYVITNNDEMEAPVRELQRLFYTHNQIIGLTSYMNLSTIEKCHTDRNYWLEYINKNQQNFLFKSPQRQQKETQRALDAGIVSFSRNNLTLEI